jgi:hypothetical protein
MTTGRADVGICDWSGCERCVSEGKAGYADIYFNADHVLWGVCETHAVRWYVTRELLGIEEDAGALGQYAEVEGVYRMRAVGG